MLLTVEKHIDYKVYDKNGKIVGRLQEFDTETKVGKQVRTEGGEISINESGEIVVDTIIIEGGYAIDPQGNKVK